jgi:medium-chain acyl-[acyl-carrier-protein] hydrolase
VVSSDRWLPFSRHRPRVGLPLFCLPYAGGGAAAFRHWREALSPSIDPLAVEFPGRGSRLRDVPFRRVDDLATATARALTAEWQRPYALFGHSLGAFVAFEMTRLLQTRGTPPVHLFVSGSRAPHLPAPADPAYRLEGEALRERLGAWGGLDESLLAEPDVFAMLEPGLRADLEAAETYRCSSVEDLRVPITAFGGLDDPLALPDAVGQWSIHTSARFRVRALPGGHFFVRDSRPKLLEMIRQELRR